MADIPFHECASARQEEASEARERLLTSLEVLRTRADNFVAVVESTATMFAALATSPSRSWGTVPEFRRPPDIGGLDAEARGPSEYPADGPALFTNGNGASLYPDALRPGTVLGCHAHGAGVTKMVIPKAVMSTNAARAVAGSPFSFTVTTTGTPVPSVTRKGDLPDHVEFIDNGDGTATLSGTPEAVGEFRVTVRARFGKKATKYVATQTFTLTVAAADGM